MTHYILLIEDNFNRDALQTEIANWLSRANQNSVTITGKQLRFGIEDEKDKEFKKEIWPLIKDRVSSHEESKT